MAGVVVEMAVAVEVVAVQKEGTTTMVVGVDVGIALIKLSSGSVKTIRSGEAAAFVPEVESQGCWIKCNYNTVILLKS